jgi:hypothetical protein
MFEKEGNVKERKQPWALAVHLPENMEAFRLAMQHSSEESTQKASHEYGIS